MTVEIQPVHVQSSTVWRRRVVIRRTLVVGRALILYALMVAVGVTFLFPFLWMLSTSLKTDAQVFTNPPIWIPNPVEFGNYVDALVMVPTARYFVNTLIITVVPMCAVVISSAIVAFAFARLEWPGRNVLFAVLLSTMMLPGQVTMIPLFVLFHRMGWTNTFKPLVVPSFFASAFYVFLLRQFFMGIPKEFDEAATMDGATPPLIWWRIIMPLAGPALAAVAVFSFVGNWNSFMEPLIYLRTAKKWPLALGLVAFRDEYYTQWQHLMAYSVIVMLPCLIVFFFSQRYFIQGITLSGLKG